MDLRIAGKKALVCASSKGLGRACATALAREGCIVTINGRDATRLAAVADEICTTTGVRVHAVAADLNTPVGRDALIAACAGTDILVTNNAGPPPGQLGDWDHAAWLAALEANMLAPVLLISALVPGMRARKFGRIVNITSAMVKSPRPAMALSTAARAGLTAFCKSLSLDIAADNVVINNLLPERFETDRQKQMVDRAMQLKGITHEQARAEITQSIAARRFGDPEELGAACVFLCGEQAGFISGQNLQLDGGSYAGLI
jgi:3-oxoacyl-[acyl-carrier protein] reductase